jgi:hypothetical protein
LKSLEDQYAEEEVFWRERMVTLVDNVPNEVLAHSVGGSVAVGKPVLG